MIFTGLDEAARDEGEEAMADAQRGEKRALGRGDSDDEGPGKDEGVTYKDGRAVLGAP